MGEAEMADLALSAKAGAIRETDAEPGPSNDKDQHLS